ncbi:hypothetical protein [Oceanicoccus sp. KOV_DT_Chl]|uniref:hypothetical protein n=1 Tax=Oceanicoccus sp. KOV_DT_Chl TaxID=1904639 RepID=UPI000C7A8643|nr:hypothetical protein [Oceanicoccus sp. KOV_DT_Chl]
MSLSIKNRLFLLAAVTVVALVIIGVIVANSVSTLHKIEQSDTLLSDLKVNMLTLRRHEKDFLARKDLKYVEAFNVTAEEGLSDLKKLSAQLNDADIEAPSLDSMGAC